MSIHAITWAFAQHETTPTQRLVLLALADWANAEGQAYPSIEKLMAKTGLSQATVYRALSDLVRDGYMAEDRSQGYRRWTFSQREDFSQGENDSSHGENRTNTKEPSGTVTEPAPDEDDIQKVWDHYVTRPGKRGRPLPPEERKVIRAALRVATADELIRCINLCWESDYHMKRGRYRDRNGPKYNALSQIIKGRQGRETTRERIDFWLERSEETTGFAGSGFPSADPAVIARRKQEVQRGHRLTGDPVAMRKAKEAEAWLRTHGYETIRGEDGYPTFRPMDEAPAAA